MTNLCKFTLTKANESLKSCGKQISVQQNTDHTFALYLNGMLIFWSIPADRLFLNIMKVFMFNLKLET